MPARERASRLIYGSLYCGKTSCALPRSLADELLRCLRSLPVHDLLAPGRTSLEILSVQHLIWAQKETKATKNTPIRFPLQSAGPALPHILVAPPTPHCPARDRLLLTCSSPGSRSCSLRIHEKTSKSPRFLPLAHFVPLAHVVHHVLTSPPYLLNWISPQKVAKFAGIFHTCSTCSALAHTYSSPAATGTERNSCATSAVRIIIYRPHHHRIRRYHKTHRWYRIWKIIPNLEGSVHYRSTLRSGFARAPGADPKCRAERGTQSTRSRDQACPGIDGCVYQYPPYNGYPYPPQAMG